MSIRLFLILFLAGTSLCEQKKTCEEKCANGFIYLSVDRLVLQRNEQIDFLTSENSVSKETLSIIRDDLGRYIFGINLQFDEYSGIHGSIRVKLEPHFNKTQDSLTLFVNKTSVCVLFQKDCDFQCNEIPKILVEHGKLFTYGQIEIDRKFSETDNKTEVYYASDKCRHKLLDEDGGHLKKLKNEIASIYNKFIDAVTYFGFIGSGIFKRVSDKEPDNNNEKSVIFQALETEPNENADEVQTTEDLNTIEIDTTTEGISSTEILTTAFEPIEDYIERNNEEIDEGPGIYVNLDEDLE